jgi:hypothetical protein
MKDYPGSQPARGKYETKGGVFVLHGGRPMGELEKRAKYYFAEHPDFLYTALQQKQLARGQRARAEANALLALEFISRYELSPSNTVVEIHRVNGKPESEHIIFLTSQLLKMAGLNVPVSYRNKAKHNQSIRRADMLGYYLAGLKFRNPTAKWPCRNRKLNLADLADRIIDAKFPETATPLFPNP